MCLLCGYYVLAIWLLGGCYVLARWLLQGVPKKVSVSTTISVGHVINRATPVRFIYYIYLNSEHSTYLNI